MRLSPDRRLAAFVLLLGLVAAACSDPAESGVNVKALATDLVYGIPEPEQPAPPANFDPVPSDPIGTVTRGGGDPGPIEIPAPPSDPCPATPPNVFPPAAPSLVEGRPAEGQYRWKNEGHQEIPGVGTVQMPPFNFRKVLDVSDVDGGFSFVVEERELTFGSPFVVRTTYEVITEGGTEVIEETDPRGMFISKIERFAPNDSTSHREFNPSPPVEILPLPVSVGDTIDSVGVDPVSFEVMRLEGGITKRERVDACGEPMDAYYVRAQQSRVAADGTVTARRYDYGISTNLGGLPILEHIESPCANGGSGPCPAEAVTFFLDAHIAQLEPDPPRED